jgi:hypothetical protein
MAHKPSGLEGHPDGPMKLVGAKALLGSRQQVDGLEPEVHRNMAILKNGPDLDGKLLPAGIALIEANAGSLAVHLADSLFAPAVGANRAMEPYPSLDKGIGGFFILQVGCGN